MLKKLFVTGGSGYIGSEFVHQCHKNGYEITVFDNLEYGFKSNIPKGVRLIVGDLRDYRSIQTALHETKPDIVVHFAAYALVGESMKNPLKYFSNNITGGINLLMAMEQCGCKRIIFSSTCATYGVPDHMPITENTPQNPINPYGQSKLMFESILKTMVELKGFRCTIFRYFNAAGSDTDHNLFERHDPETHIIPNIFKSISEGRKFNLYGNDYETEDGSCVRDYVHIKDIASAHLIAMEKDITGEFNLGTGNGVSNLELVSVAEKVSGRGVEVNMADRRQGDPPNLIADCRLANEKLGWRATHSSIREIMEDSWRGFEDEK